jgi:beta-phosphoglucomutase
MSLRAIIFDFDGVLANSEPLHFQGFRDVLADEGVALTRDDYYTRYLGYDDAGVFQAIAEERGAAWTAAHVGDLVARKAVRLEALERDGSILFPGAAAAVRRAAAAVPVAIASGALRADIRRVLDRELLTSCFTAIVAAEDAPFSKPAPDPYLRALVLLAPALGGHIAARECVAVEDSHWGLASARAAGLRTVGITHTYGAPALADADLVIDSLDALELRALTQLCSR